MTDSFMVRSRPSEIAAAIVLLAPFRHSRRSASGLTAGTGKV
jgi:hypothetical protein